jgi:succinylglutamic semialdehyde dehydrogenase
MSGEEIVSIEPATGAVYWRGEAGDVDQEVALAREAWPQWAACPVTVRIEALRRFVDVVRSKNEDLADCIARETGKPLWEARTEVESVIAKVDISIKAFADRTSQRRIEGAMGTKTAVRHKPHGVMAVLGPYNFPAHLPNGHIVPALIAGNAIVFKPSEKTPATGAMLVDLFHAAGIPAGVIRCLIGGVNEGKALAAHPDVDGLLFTGSSNTGIALNRLYADMPGKVLALEMGGNNPIVVWDTPDILTAATIVVQSAFLSAGQRCTSARRLIVRNGAHEALIQEIIKVANRLIVDEPHATPAPFMGPVIDNETADAMQESFMSLMMRGGSPLKNMERTIEGRPFLNPAIIDMTGSSDRPDIELFGPLLQVIRVDDFDEAIAESNATRYGLSASLIGGTPQLYDKFWANIRAGVINWNKPTNGAPSGAPFGGIGLSGNHRPSAYYAADYCAYPVVSTEDDNARAAIGVGLRELAPSFAK